MTTTQAKEATVPQFGLAMPNNQLHVTFMEAPPDYVRHEFQQASWIYIGDTKFITNQSYQSWTFLQDFCDRYSPFWNPDAQQSFKMYIDSRVIPEQYRIPPAPPAPEPEPEPEPEPVVMTQVPKKNPDHAVEGQMAFGFMEQMLGDFAQKMSVQMASFGQQVADQLGQVAAQVNQLAEQNQDQVNQLAQLRAEVEELKKPVPLVEVEKPLEARDWNQPTTTEVSDTTEKPEEPTSPSIAAQVPLTPKPILEKPAPRKSPHTGKAKIITKFPSPQLLDEIVDFNESWDDDPSELADTAGYHGCYAEYRGRLGLSFVSLAQPCEMMANGQIYTARPNTFQPLVFKYDLGDRVRGMLTIRQSYSALIEVEGNPAATDDDVEQSRNVLNLAYDDFVGRFGTLHQNRKLMQFCGLTDDRLFILLALERECPETGEHIKADIFFERQQFPVAQAEGQLFFGDDMEERCKSAYFKVLDEFGGAFDLDRCAQLAGMDSDEVADILVNMEPPLILRVPEIETIEEEYQSAIL